MGERAFVLGPVLKQDRRQGSVTNAKTPVCRGEWGVYCRNTKLCAIQKGDLGAYNALFWPIFGLLENFLKASEVDNITFL